MKIGGYFWWDIFTIGNLHNNFMLKELQENYGHLFEEALINEINQAGTYREIHEGHKLMEIGDYVMFMYKGQMLWEGPNTDILNAKVSELQDFVYSNKLMMALKEQSS